MLLETGGAILLIFSNLKMGITYCFCRYYLRNRNDCFSLVVIQTHYTLAMTYPVDML